MTTKRTLGVHDAIKFLTLLDDDLTAAQIQQRLEWLGLPEASTFLVGQIRGQFRADMRFLERVGLLRDRTPTIPDAIRRLKPPKTEPAPRYYLGRQSRDD